MGTVYKQEGYSKDEAFMRDIICVYNPTFRDMSKRKQAEFIELARQGCFNTEMLVEQTISLRATELGRTDMEQSNETGMDYVDGSDAKTCIVASYWDKSKGRHDFKGRISHIDNKVGPLRIVLLNEWWNGIENYFLPYDYWTSVSNNNRINLTTSDYSNGEIPALKDYKCDDFDELCLATEEGFVVPDKPTQVGLEAFF